jgi:hypothetical protein
MMEKVESIKEANITVGDNSGLINYYTKCGFEFLGLLRLKNTEGLPAHYDNATISLFQITINSTE